MAGQAERLAVVMQLHACQVDLEGAATCRARLRWRHPRLQTLEDGLDPSRHLARAERLADIVIGANLQPHHPVDLAVARGKKQHRHLAAAAQLLACLKTAHVRQADIENPQIGRLTRLQRQRLAGQTEPTGREALALQGIDQGIGDCRFVFDDEDMGHDCASFCLPAKCRRPGPASTRAAICSNLDLAQPPDMAASQF